MLGFVGNTGDAHTTDPHLHFEVHPNGLLYLGYDGAVDPTTYLARWHRPDQVRMLPPVVLPSHAPAGQGSIADFRRLLALHPLARTRAAAEARGQAGNRVARGRKRCVRQPFRPAPAAAPPLVAAVLLLLLAAARSA